MSLELTAPTKDFGGLSALHVAADGEHFLSLSDKGFWLRGRIVYGNGAAISCQALGNAGVVPAMCHLNPLIQKKNITVTYEMSGLGYYGRPGGAVVTIRMGLVATGDDRLFFNLPLLGALIGLSTITVPAMPVTVTSEDLRTNSGA